MKRKLLFLIFFMAVLCTPSQADKENRPDPKPVRVAVIGGMTMTPLWGELQKRFEADTGIPVRVVVTGTKPVLARAMKEGRVVIEDDV